MKRGRRKEHFFFPKDFLHILFRFLEQLGCKDNKTITVQRSNNDIPNSYTYGPTQLSFWDWLMNRSRKVSIRLTIGSTLEKERMRSIGPGFRFKVWIMAVLYWVLVYRPLPQMLVVGNHIAFKRPTRSSLKQLSANHNWLAPWRGRYGKVEFLGTELLSGFFLRVNDT